MTKRLEDLMDLDSPEFPENIRKMVKDLPDIGKEALAAWYDEDSEFYQHAQQEIIAKKFLLDTNEKINKNIYHYTSVDSFKKIVQSKVFLIKEKSYMNDPEEFEYTFSLAKNELKRLGATDSELGVFGQLHNSSPFNDMYIWSFTRNGESQTLFGNYNGADRDGVALQFNSQDVQEQLAAHFAHDKKSLDEFTEGNAYVFPLRVVYAKKEQLEFIQPVITEWLKALRCLNLDRYDMSEILLDCLKALTLFAMCFKNPYLRQEEEVRFLVLNINSDSKNHPEVEIGETPFVQCEINSSFLKSVIMQTNGTTTVDELKDMLVKKGFSKTEVRKSVLPY